MAGLCLVTKTSASWTTRPTSATSCGSGTSSPGHIVYRIWQDAIALLHTEVLEDFEGHGLEHVVARALDDIRGRGLRLIPICPFVRSYLERHPDQADLVEPRVLEGG